MGLLPDEQVVALLRDAARLRQQRKYKSCLYILTELSARDERCVAASEELLLEVLRDPGSAAAVAAGWQKVRDAYRTSAAALAALGAVLTRRRQEQREAWEDYLQGSDSSSEEEEEEEEEDGDGDEASQASLPELCREGAIAPLDAISVLQAALALDPLDVRAAAALDAATSLAFNRYHFPMLNDASRNAAYLEGLRRTIAGVRAADPTCPIHVVDIGAGTGLLSIYATGLDANIYVTAYEACDAMQSIAKHVLRANGVPYATASVHTEAPARKKRKAGAVEGGRPERVLLVAARSTRDPAFPRSPFAGTPHATVIVTETFDCGLFGEGVWSTMRHALAALGNSAGRGVHVVPSAAELVGCVVESAPLQDEFFATAREVAGARIAPAIGRGELHETPVHAAASAEPYTSSRLALHRTPPRRLTEVKRLAALDLTTGAAAAERVEFSADHAGTAVAVAAWMQLRLAEEVELTTAPGGVGGAQQAAAVCWEQAVFPMQHVTAVAPGAALDVTFELLARGGGDEALYCGVGTAGQHVFSYDEIRRLNDVPFWEAAAAALAESIPRAVGRAWAKAAVASEGACWYAMLLLRAYAVVGVSEVFVEGASPAGSRAGGDAWLRESAAATAPATQLRLLPGDAAPNSVASATPDVCCGCVVLPTGLLEHPGGWEALAAARRAGVPTCPAEALLSFYLIQSDDLLRYARVADGDPAAHGVAGLGTSLAPFQPRVYPDIDLHALAHTRLSDNFGRIDLLAAAGETVCATFTVRATAPGIIHAVPFFADLALAPGACTISTLHPAHHWKVAAVLVPPRAVAAGETLRINVAVGHGTVAATLS